MIYGQIWMIDDKSNLVTYAVKLILILVWCWVVDTMIPWYCDESLAGAEPGIIWSALSTLWPGHAAPHSCSLITQVNNKTNLSEPDLITILSFLIH